MGTVTELAKAALYLSADEYSDTLNRTVGMAAPGL
jgi:hypothetical protein